MTTTSATTSTGPKGFRWLYLILGIVLFVFGVGIIRHPVASYFGLAMYFSIVIIVIGISEIMNAFAGGNSRHWGWGWIFIAGIITLFFSFMIVFYPLFGIFNIIIWTGLSFIFAGISSFVYAFVGRG